MGKLQPCIPYPLFHFLVQAPRPVILNQNAGHNHLQGIFNLFPPFPRAKFGEDRGKEG